MPRHATRISAPLQPKKGADRPQDLPHGLIRPPEKVSAILEREKAKAPKGFFIDEAWQRMVDELSLQYYFEDLGHEVLYRSTPAGPEVLAVGFDEIQAFTEDMVLDEQLKLQTWTP
jgi:hypothetical protein